MTTPLRDGEWHPESPLWLRDLDLREASVAPSLGEAPVPQAVLAAAFNLFSSDQAYDEVGPGRVHLLTPDGHWRRLDYADYGYTGRFHTESSFELSPDGRQLAMADGNSRTMVVVQLADNSYERYRLPIRQPVRMRWAPDSSTITFVRRHTIAKKDPGFELDLDTGRVRKTRYEVAFSEFAGTRRKVVELWRDEDGLGVINTYRDGRRRSSQLLEYSDILGFSPKVRRLLAYDRRVYGRDRHLGAVDGIAVVDPATGKLHAMLADAQVRTTWTRALEWITGRELAFASSKPGLVKSWNVDSGRIRVLASFVNRGVNVSLAPEPAAEVF